MSKFEEWWKTHRYEWEFTDEEEGLALIAAEYAWDAAIDSAVKVSWECSNSGDAAIAIRELKK